MFFLSLLIFIFILALIFMLLLRKRKWTTTKLMLISALLGLISAPILYFGLFFAYMSYVDYYPKKDFNETAWNTEVDKRFEMSKDIIDSDMLIGMDSVKLHQLLGRPDIVDSVSLQYYIGFIPGFISLDPDYLYLEIKADTVFDVSIMKH